MSTSVRVVAGILLAILFYLALGGISLAQQQIGIDAATGEVWNQIDAGAQKLDRLEAQVIGAYRQQMDVVNAIVEGRKALAEARARGDLTAATQAAGQIGLNINVLVEANPVTPLTELQRGLLDETSGAFNRIAYARGRLIDTQKAYNQTRIAFFPIAGFFPPVEILGSTDNPRRQLPPSRFVTPAAVPTR